MVICPRPWVHSLIHVYLDSVSCLAQRLILGIIGADVFIWGWLYMVLTWAWGDETVGMVWKLSPKTDRQGLLGNLRVVSIGRGRFLELLFFDAAFLSGRLSKWEFLSRVPSLAPIGSDFIYISVDEVFIWWGKQGCINGAFPFLANRVLGSSLLRFFKG